MIPIQLILAVLNGTSAFKLSSKEPKPLIKPYDQYFADKYSPLKYLGGLGPYSSRIGNGISTDVPEGCEVDQVILLQRNGEQYPDASVVKSHKSTLSKLKKSHPQPFTGDLEFLNDWEYFLQNEGDAGLEIQSGPYAGTADLYSKGTEFRGRYGDLWDGQSKVPIFASSNEAIVQSARAFGEGFFGYNYSDIAEVNIVSTEKSAGGNSLSPSFCDAKARNSKENVSNIIYPEFDVAAIRLNEQYGLSLTGENIVDLFEIGSYDLAANGVSPWLDLFTREEWLAFNYLKGVALYSRTAGSSVGRAIGAHWANATSKLLNQGPEDSGLPLVLNFGYDSDITNFLGALGILAPLKNLDVNQVTFDTRWDINDIVPQGAQLVLERLSCKAPGLTNNTDLISSNATLPESYLNNTYGIYNLSNPAGYFSPNYTNSSTINATSVYKNGTKVPFSNHTEQLGKFNLTTIVTNSTNGSTTVTNVTSIYGFNATNGTTNGKAEEKSIFVRLILNDAVVPIDFGYEGPGYSIPLTKLTKTIEKQVATHNYSEVCKPKEAGVTSEIDFYWKYNSTTKYDTTNKIPWQGTPVN